MTAPKPVTLARAADEYLATLATESTKRTYGAALKAMRGHFGDETELADLKAQDVAAWIQEQWPASESSSGTFNVRLRAIRSAAAWWAVKGWIPEGLTDGIEPRASRNVLAAEILTPEEVKALMAAALGPSLPRLQSPTGIRNKALIMLLWSSGLRISEALSLKPGDIDHDARSIRLLHTKSGQAQTRYYRARAEGDLRRWLERRAALGFNGRQPVFCTISTDARSKPGNPLPQNYVRYMLRQSAKEAGIDKRVHAHGFRHAFTVELVREGADIETIRKLLGQSSLTSTAKYLASLTNEAAGAALRALDDFQQVTAGGETDEGKTYRWYSPDQEEAEKSVEEQLAALRRELAELRQCKGEK